MMASMNLMVKTLAMDRLQSWKNSWSLMDILFYIGIVNAFFKCLQDFFF